MFQLTKEELENELAIKKDLDETPFMTTGTDDEQLRANSILAARRARAAGFIKRCELAMNGVAYPCTLHVAAIDDGTLPKSAKLTLTCAGYEKELTVYVRPAKK